MEIYGENLRKQSVAERPTDISVLCCRYRYVGGRRRSLKVGSVKIFPHIENVLPVFLRFRNDNGYFYLFGRLLSVAFIDKRYEIAVFIHSRDVSFTACHFLLAERIGYGYIAKFQFALTRRVVLRIIFRYYISASVHHNFGKRRARNKNGLIGFVYGQRNRFFLNISDIVGCRI